MNLAYWPWNCDYIGMASRKTHPVKHRSWKQVVMYTLPVVLLIVGGLAYMTNAAESDTGLLSKEDRAFLLEAADNRMTDWAEGQLAADKGSNALYQQYGKRVMHDQDKMMKALHTLASEKKVELPEKLSAEREEDLSYLNATRGEWFDRRFRRLIIRNHKRDIDAFKDAAKSKDPEVRAFAQHYLPMFEKHLQMARDLNQ
jgi:putative membrane protein